MEKNLTIYGKEINWEKMDVVLMSRHLYISPAMFANICTVNNIDYTKRGNREQKINDNFDPVPYVFPLEVGEDVQLQVLNFGVMVNNVVSQFSSQPREDYVQHLLMLAEHVLTGIQRQAKSRLVHELVYYEGLFYGLSAKGKENEKRNWEEESKIWDGIRESMNDPERQKKINDLISKIMSI